MLKLCLLFFHLCKALATINRTIIFGLERNLCLAATACTSCCVHLSIAFSSVLSCIAASLASLGLVYKAFFSIELLLTCCKNELLTAFLTNKGFVFVHFATSLEKNYFYPKRNCTAAKMLS